MERQASTTRESSTGRGHLGATTAAVLLVLLVREAPGDERDLPGTYRFLGTATRVEDRGERLIAITYRLQDGEIPPDLLRRARSAVA